jgi:hypothetical protein
MLKNIIQRLAEDTGMHLVQDRAALVNLANRAASMLHTRLECNDIMRETTVLVPENKVIALPSFIGSLRGMRETERDWNFSLYPMMQPRFMRDGWLHKYRNWRELHGSPIYRDLTVIGPLTIEAEGVESTPAVLKISGQTDTAQKVEEELTLSLATGQTSKTFGPIIYSIASFSERSYNISIKDDNGTECAILYNNEEKTHYKLIDVSEFQWTKDVSDGRTTIDLLYKQPLYKMVNDSDEFPADNYDDTIYFQAMSLWASTQPGKEQLMTTFAQQAMMEPHANKNNQEQGQTKKLNFGRNPLYGAIRRRSAYSYAVNRPLP